MKCTKRRVKCCYIIQEKDDQAPSPTPTLLTMESNFVNKVSQMNYTKQIARFIKQ